MTKHRPGPGPILLVAAVAACGGAPGRPEAPPQAQGTSLLAVFAHPDDEIYVAPILARYAREGARVYLVIATDGARGGAPHATIPLGEALAAARAQEAACATRELGIEQPILLGFGDGALGAIVSPPNADLERLASKVREAIATVKPDAILTWGPEGAYGHPDHRLVSSVVMQVVQAGGPPLFTPGLRAEDIVRGKNLLLEQQSPVEERLLRVRVRFDATDLDRAKRAFRCHRSQFDPETTERILDGMQRAWNGVILLQPWFGAPAGDGVLGR